MFKTFAFALLAMLPAGVFAQTVTRQDQVTRTATITAIDNGSRSIGNPLPLGRRSSASPSSRSAT